MSDLIASAIIDNFRPTYEERDYDQEEDFYNVQQQRRRRDSRRSHSVDSGRDRR